ncbi:hypothetical protein PROFUN_02050 [Planoprotostelium fungivorum]|uniref:Uncharacterized protein n=1 Tax=Planoprotostelium fungivorum TaxID=1890364 RepID=A0A2P6NB90_9EUKA|nr:hypothetical protein PROFUN_02050 [Planoprotostelium fungivorum]
MSDDPRDDDDERERKELDEYAERFRQQVERAEEELAFPIDQRQNVARRAARSFRKAQRDTKRLQEFLETEREEDEDEDSQDMMEEEESEGYSAFYEISDFISDFGTKRIALESRLDDKWTEEEVRKTINRGHRHLKRLQSQAKRSTSSSAAPTSLTKLREEVDNLRALSQSRDKGSNEMWMEVDAFLREADVALRSEEEKRASQPCPPARKNKPLNVEYVLQLRREVEQQSRLLDEKLKVKMMIIWTASLTLGC